MGEVSKILALKDAQIFASENILEDSAEKGILDGEVFQNNRKFGMAELLDVRKVKGSSKNGK